MAKFMYLYYAGKETDAGDDAAWGAWFGSLGDKLVDAGNPLDSTGAQAVHAGGKMAVTDRPATGYSIVDVNDMQEALMLAKSCPLVMSDGAVAVYEALPM